MIATVLLWVFWRGRAPRLAFLLFAFSPCLLLYGRMARSYAMQTALVVLTVAMLERWMRNPPDRRWAMAGWASMTALLYTHYAPGGAVLLGFLAVAWRTLGLRRAALFAVASAAAYAPWAALSVESMRRFGAQTSFSAKYAVTGSLMLEHLLKLGFGGVSLAIGESFAAASLLLVPVVWLLAVRGLRTGVFPAAWIALAAAIGYVGVSRWVSYPFVPARLLWLLPFLCLAVAAGAGRRRWIAVALLVSHALSIALYFRRENFLNLGYVAPLPEIVATLNREAGPEDAILLDPYNTDFAVIVAGLSGETSYVVLDGRPPLPRARTYWIVRNTHDASPGATTSAAESRACAGRERRDTLLDPYAPWQRFVLARLGEPQTHFYRLTSCRQLMDADRRP
jgi:hypothetical protein